MPELRPPWRPATFTRVGTRRLGRDGRMYVVTPVVDQTSGGSFRWWVLDRPPLIPPERPTRRR